MSTKKNAAKTAKNAAKTVKKATAKKNASTNRKPARGENPRPKSWTDITGVMRVWGKEVEGKKKKKFMSYSTSVGVMDEESGEWSNVYFNVRFRKGEDPGVVEGFKIKVKAGFITISVSREGATYPAVMILDYDIIEEEESEEEESEEEESEEEESEEEESEEE